MSDNRHTCLLAVDMQPDFMPGGALAVAEGDLILEPICELMASNRFPRIVATQDWHPPGHISFASSHPGRKPFDVITLYDREQVLWPDHCVQGTPGAALHAKLPMQNVIAIVRKGTDPLVDSYSAFRNNWDKNHQRPRTGLGGYLKELGITDVYLCGLARDYCVKWSAEDAVEIGLRTTVIWDLTRPVDPSSDPMVRASLEEIGVRIIESGELS